MGGTQFSFLTGWLEAGGAACAAITCGDRDLELTGQPSPQAPPDPLLSQPPAPRPPGASPHPTWLVAAALPAHVTQQQPPPGGGQRFQWLVPWRGTRRYCASTPLRWTVRPVAPALTDVDLGRSQFLVIIGLAKKSTCFFP